METTELRPRETPTGNGATPARLARKKFDPTQLFAQRDRLPWFWFFVAVAVSVAAALDLSQRVFQQLQSRKYSLWIPSLCSSFHTRSIRAIRRQKATTPARRAFLVGIHPVLRRDGRTPGRAAALWAAAV